MAIAEQPKGFGLVQGLMIVQIGRALGAVFFVPLSQGLLPATFAIPAAIGDILIAITAPLAVIAIRRGALLSWMAALAWNFLGITDFAVAVSEGFLSSANLMFTLPWILIPTVAVPAYTALHVITIALLMRRPMRSYFARRDLEVTR